MTKEIFEKWKHLQNEGVFLDRQISDLYEEEGKDLLNSYANGATSLEQGWTTTFSLTNNILGDILKASGGKREVTVLDLGCGASPRLLAALRTKTDEVLVHYVGGDISHSKLKVFNNAASTLCQKNKHHLLCLDCFHLPFEDSAFDIVICDDTIEHLTDPGKGIREIGRILKDGGSAIISTPNRNRPDVLIRKFIDLFKRQKKDKASYYMAISHLVEFTHREFIKLIREAGMDIERSFTLNYPFSVEEIKKAGYFVKVPAYLLKIPYQILNLLVASFKQRGLSTHIFLLCSKNKS